MVSSNLTSQPYWLETFSTESPAYGFDEGGMWFSGDAGGSVYPIRTNYDIDSETRCDVIYTFTYTDVDEGCPDHGICFFKADTEPYWNWGSNVTRIAVQYDCGTPEIAGVNDSAGSSYHLTAGQTYTGRVIYWPSNGYIIHELYEGAGIDGSMVDQISLNERLDSGAAYRVGFDADLDLSVPDKAYFTYLELSVDPPPPPPDTPTRVFRALHFPHRRREAENEINGAPTEVQPGEVLYGETENKLYVGKDDGTVAVVAGGSNSSANLSLITQFTPWTQNPPGMARIVTTYPGNDTFNFWVRSTTGYTAVRWWDGNVSIYGDGWDYNDIYANYPTPSSGAFSGNSPKDVYVWSCVGPDNAGQYGDITYLDFGGRHIAHADVQNLTALDSLWLNNNSIRALNLTGCTGLTLLNLYNNPYLTALDITPCAALQYLYSWGCALTSVYLQGNSNLIEIELYNNAFTQIDLTGLSALEYLNLSNCGLTTLDVSPCPSLQGLSASGNQLTTLNLTECVNLRWCEAYDNQLTSVIATGIDGSTGKTWIGLWGNQLSADGLNAFFTSLGTFVGWKTYIDVTNNPGSCSCDPTIATAKNWYVYTGC